MRTERSEDARVASSASLSAARRRQLGRRAQLLAGASVGYNVLEAALSMAVGVAASSTALFGFGLDSLVEVGSGLVILWQFRHPIPETREKQALRLIAVSFFALAAYVTFESVRTLTGAGEASPSVVGVAVAAASLLVMPLLSWAQRRTGRQLGSGSVVADSKQTLLCTYLSAVLLLGLLANALLGWSWADPVAALVIAAVAVREGVEAWRGETCECGPTAPSALGVTAEAPSHDDCCDDRCDDECCAAPDDGASPSPAEARPHPGQAR